MYLKASNKLIMTEEETGVQRCEATLEVPKNMSGFTFGVLSLFQ